MVFPSLREALGFLLPSAGKSDYHSPPQLKGNRLLLLKIPSSKNGRKVREPVQKWGRTLAPAKGRPLR